MSAFATPWCKLYKENKVRKGVLHDVVLKISQRRSLQFIEPATCSNVVTVAGEYG
jgi:hypothetical protein